MTSSTNADILWSAYIDDHTDVFFQQFNNNLTMIASRSRTSFTQVRASISTVETQAKSAQTAVQKTGAALGVVGGIVGGVTAAFLRMGQQGVRQLKALATNAVMLAARADTLAVALEVVGGNVGYTRDELDDLTKSVEENGITTIAARQTLLQLAEANLDLTKSVDLSRVAQDAAVIAGINSSEATQRMIHGIVSLNPLILKHMGLYVNLTQEYMKATGASQNVANSLSIQEKQAIALNAVIKAGTRIEGAYEAAMETAGKQAGSTARFMEQLLVAIGGVAQPAFFEFITRFNQGLVDMTDYIENNQEAMEKLAKALADAMEFTLDALEKVNGALKEIPPLALAAATDIAQIVNQDMEEPQVVESLKRFAVWWVRQFASDLQFVLNLLEAVVTFFKAIWKSIILIANVFAKNDLARATEEWGAALEDLSNIVVTTRAEMDAAGDSAAAYMERLLGLTDDMGEEAEDAADAAVDALYKIGQETEQVVAKIEELNDKIGKDLAEAAIEAARDAIEEEIRLQHKLEDMARRRTRRTEDILRSYDKRRRRLLRDMAEEEAEAAEDAAEDREDAATDHANALLEIEIDYRRKLEDIKRNFEWEASEAARRNDAVTVARLIRNMAKETEEARIARDRDIEDENRDYQEELDRIKLQEERKRKERAEAADHRLEDLEEDLQDELDALDRSFKREMEDLQIAQQRDRELKELHRQWDMEDLQRKYDEELRMMGQHFASLEYLDEAALRLLLEQHGQYITNDIALWDEYYRLLEERARQYAATATAYMNSRTYRGGPYPGQEGNWGFQSGGVGIATYPQQVTIAEAEPEMIAAIPLSAVVNYNHNINMSGDLNVQGVSPAAEADLVPAIMTVLAQFGQQLLARGG